MSTIPSRRLRLVKEVEKKEAVYFLAGKLQHKKLDLTQISGAKFLHLQHLKNLAH